MTQSATSAYGPFRSRNFRMLWIGGAAFYIGNAMQLTAAAWLVTETTHSPFLSALAQTAAYFPMFALSLPAGVLADTKDRRTLILNALYVYIAAAWLLGALASTRVGGPAVLLGLVTLMGAANALQSPAWRSAVTDSVPRPDLPQAVTLASIAFNGARVVGPALAGAMFSIASGGLVFALSGVAAMVMAVLIIRSPPSRHPASKLPVERLWSGMRSGMRYVRHSDIARAPLIHCSAFNLAGSALWALLPAIALQRLAMEASGYGMLLGCLGIGAVATGLAMARLRAMASTGAMLVGCSFLFAMATLVTALTTNHAAVYAALVGGGASWLASLSSLNAIVQTGAPAWVRARALAIFTVFTLGSFSLGSALWGALSLVVGITPTLMIAGGLLLLTALLPRWIPLRMGGDKDVTLAEGWGDVEVAEHPATDAGPVAVEIVYCVETGNAQAFLDTLVRLREPRRRDGATLWRAYRDLSDPTRFVERFIVSSWGHYLRQRAHATVADQEIEHQVRGFQAAGREIATRHYIAER
ncbi:MFS transporter [soil metagenome]